jgi:hypothetical protein
LDGRGKRWRTGIDAMPLEETLLQREATKYRSLAFVIPSPTKSASFASNFFRKEARRTGPGRDASLT